jgi:tetratricopeptide (TPR) repeat protein
MKSLIKIFVFSFLIINVMSASQIDDLMKQGNAAYQNGNYQNAISDYEKLVNDGYEGVSLYYNLGNAYYKDGKLGYSILYYEKALKLAPNDDDIQHNLAIANSKTIDKINTLPRFFIFQWWESLLSFFSVKGWTYFTYVLFILILAAAGVYFFIKNPLIQRYSFFGGLAILVLFILSAVMLAINVNRQLNVKNGIIIAQAVSAKLSPDTKSNDAFVIHEGLKVKMEDKVDDWVKVRLNDGKIGWLPQNDIAQI